MLFWIGGGLFILALVYVVSRKARRMEDPEALHRRLSGFGCCSDED